VDEAELHYDPNGNVTTDQNGLTLIYDAWNRLVEATDGESSLIRYTFDALNRRIGEGTNHVYFTASWQAIEERDDGGDVTVQYVWSPVYVDAMIERDRDTNTEEEGLEERLYVLQDANWNVTAIADDEGTVLERFIYDAYGKQSVLEEDWDPTSDAYGFLHGHQGGKLDADTGLMLFRNREYSPELMRWMQEDYGGGYVDGMNLYGFVRENPNGLSDPQGFGAMNVTIDADAFIPDNWLWNPYFGIEVKGDNRGISQVPGQSSRISIHVTVDLNSISLKPTVKSTIGQSFARWTTLDPGLHGIYIINQHSTNGYGVESHSVSTERISSSEVKVTIDQTGHEPRWFAFLGHGLGTFGGWAATPSIDQHYRIYFKCKAGKWIYHLKGKHDGFPDYEVHLNNVLIHSTDYKLLGNGPTSLFGDGDFSVNAGPKPVP
jgi:RHS repeat-associated protein